MAAPSVRALIRGAIVVLIAAAPAVWYACSDGASNAPAGPALPVTRLIPDLRAAIVAQRRHTDALLEVPGVVGTAVTVRPAGRAGLLLLLERSGITGLPLMLDGIPVTPRVTGRLMALSDPTKRQRPAPMGFSVGHPAITAGTIGARVRDALGHVYILSNNHVLANSNGASIGDPEYQPGPFDGGTAADQIATLSDFQVISFAANGNKTIDANLNPVALLFAGNANVTVANRIDLVLQRFGVVIDGFAPPPPGPLTDLAVTSVSGPSVAVQGSSSTVTVAVKNVGNQDVSTFAVTLQDTTEHVTVGTQSVAGLVAGAGTTVTFTWTPSVAGDHNLVARQTLPDDRATNDQRSVTITVNPPVTDVAITSFS